MLSFSSSTLRLQHLIYGICAVLLFASLSLPVAAQGNSSIAQQFQTQDRGITAAALVGAVLDNPNSVELANADRADRLIGVVSNEPLIELSNGGNGVQVVTSGLTLALVTDLNGDVVTGDKIAISPIEGVGMKAMKAAEGTTIIGTAQSDLAAAQAETRTINDKSGKEVTVRIGLVQVQVGVAYYTPMPSQKSAFVPSFLQELANNVAGQNVSPMRVLTAALILLLLFLSITVLLYSAVRSSIISIGRNPLSESAVRKSLLQVGLTVAALLVFAVAVIYLVLTA